MPKTAAVWQGSLDGLCGLYSCIFAIERISGSLGEKGRRKILFELLKSASTKVVDESLPALIAGDDCGFHSDQLVTTFNGMAPKHRRGLRANLIEEFLPTYEGRMTQLRPVFKAGGTAIIDVQNAEHWVLATGLLPGGFAVIRDPSAKRPILSRKRASSSDGVVLLPSKSKLKP